MFKYLYISIISLLSFTQIAEARSNPFAVVISPGRTFKPGGATENELSLVFGDPLYVGPSYSGGGSGPFFNIAMGTGDNYRYFGAGAGICMFPLATLGIEVGTKTWTDQVVQNYKMLYFNVFVLPIAFVRQIDAGSYYEFSRQPEREYGLMFKIPIPVFAFLD